MWARDASVRTVFQPSHYQWGYPAVLIFPQVTRRLYFTGFHMTTVRSAAIKALCRSSADRWSPRSLSVHGRESVKPRLEHFNLLWLPPLPHTSTLAHFFNGVIRGAMRSGKQQSVFHSSEESGQTRQALRVFLQLFWDEQQDMASYCQHPLLMEQQQTFEEISLRTAYVLSSIFLLCSTGNIYLSRRTRRWDLWGFFVFWSQKFSQTYLGKLSWVKLLTGSCSRRIKATVVEDSSDLDARFLIKRILHAVCWALSMVYFQQGGVLLLLMDQ